MTLLLYFPTVIPCLLECVLTYFNVYTKVEVSVCRDMIGCLLEETKFDFSIVVGSI